MGRGPSAALLQRENRACVSRFPPRLTPDRPLRYRRWRPCLQKRCRSSFPDRDGCSEWYKTAFVRETPEPLDPFLRSRAGAGEPVPWGWVVLSRRGGGVGVRCGGHRGCGSRVCAAGGHRGHSVTGPGFLSVPQGLPTVPPADGSGTSLWPQQMCRVWLLGFCRTSDFSRRPPLVISRRFSRPRLVPSHGLGGGAFELCGMSRP